MNAVSLFAGVGGFELACQRAGIRIAASVEIDKAARWVLNRRFPETPIYEDVSEVHAKNTSHHAECPGCLPVDRTDLVCGGFPCQDLSVAGRRAGLAGLRSGLFYELARIIAETAPRWVVLENVPGLLSSNGGRDMAAVVGTLGDLGYGWAYRVLDAQFFGVPQRRRRVLIVGHLGDRAAPVEVLLEPEGGPRDSAPSGEAREITSALTRSGLGGGGPDDNLAQAGHLIAACVTAREAKGPDSDATTTLITHALTSEGADASEDGTGRGTPLIAFHMTQDPISGSISPAMSAGNAEGCATIGVYSVREDQRTGAIYEMPYASAVGQAGGKPGQGYQAVREGTTVRKLTPLECERLQGFPDNWTEGQADAPRYRQMGNALAVPVGEWVMRRVVAVDTSATDVDSLNITTEAASDVA